jgi:uncharacterized coiled-coil protein SlyX
MSLEDLGAVFAQNDLESKQAAHKQATDEIQSVSAELEEQLGGSNPEMDATDRQQVRETYEQVAQEDVRNLLEDDFTLDGFVEQIETAGEELREILRSPQAEAVVEEVFQWLLATGLPPLPDETQDELRTVIKDEIGTARQAVRDAKAAHDNLRGYLGTAQEDIDQLIMDAVESTSSVSDLEALAEGLTRLSEAWVGDWELEFSTDAGESLYREILEYLETQLAEDVSTGNSINGIATNLGQKSERWDRQLDDINSEWKRIEKSANQINPPEGTYDEEDILAQVDNTVGPAVSVNRYATVLEEANEVLNGLNDACRIDIEAYLSSTEDQPVEIRDEVYSIQETATTAQDLLDESFEADDLQTVRERVEELEEKKTFLEDDFESLEGTVSTHIETTRQLAGKFDLEDQQDELNTLLTQTRKAETTDELTSLFERYQAMAEAVREPVRNQLSESQEALFTFLLENTIEHESAEDIWKQAVDELDQERGTLLNDLAELENRGLVEIKIDVQ